MKKTLIVIACLIGIVTWTASRGTAQNKLVPPKYEYAIVKWDGPDRLFYNLPSKFECVHLAKEGVTIPREAQEEEFCLAYASNKMAQEGWEPVNLDSRRIVFRRSK
jgi:hypothetical protein